VVKTFIDYLACGLVNMVNIFQPEILCIGGGISGEGQTLIDLIEKQVYIEQYGSGIVRSTKLKIAELGNDAGIVGAALLDD
jgi:glucokinase